MRNKLIIPFFAALFGCSGTVGHSVDSDLRGSTSTPVVLPAGFSVVESHPEGYFIRISSVRRADATIIRELAGMFDGRFDRVDLCLDVAHERGDEYVSIIGSQVFDYDNDQILSLDKLH